MCCSNFLLIIHLLKLSQLMFTGVWQGSNSNLLILDARVVLRHITGASTARVRRKKCLRKNMDHFRGSSFSLRYVCRGAVISVSALRPATPLSSTASATQIPLVVARFTRANRQTECARLTLPTMRQSATTAFLCRTSQIKTPRTGCFCFLLARGGGE